MYMYICATAVSFSYAEFESEFLLFPQIPRGLPLTPMTPSAEDHIDWSIMSRVAIASVTSQGTMGGLLVAGMVQKILNPHL